MISRLTVIFVGVIIGICAYFVLSWELKNGEKIGQIVDIHKSGVIFKTWECSIIRGGLSEGSGAMGKTLNLTIKDNSTLVKAKKAMELRQNINAKYHQDAFPIFSSESGGYFLDDVEFQP